MTDDPMARLSASLKRAIMRELDIPSHERLKRRRPFTNGGHTPHQIGAYLPPPIIGPLDLLPLQTTGLLRHCPLCAARAESIECQAGILAFREGRFHDPELEAEWKFWPCGCEGREILPGEGAQR